MNKTEIYQKMKAFIESDLNASDFMYEYLEWELSELPEEYQEFFKDCNMVEHYGGEGQGETFYTVWYFPGPDIYINFFGYYASYNGADYEGMEHVEPKEVKITQYHAYVEK